MEKIPLVDLKSQYRVVKDAVDAAMQRTIANTSFILGAEVSEFENQFAGYIHTRYAVGVASGTAALSLALLACGIGPEDEVITTAHTFIATAEAISHTGATPVFVDILPDTFCMDPEKVAEAVTPRTKAILPVHIYGHPADMDALAAIASAHDLFLIEDAAQAHGAEYRGRRCGSMGHMGCFSFYPGKNLGAFGDAGAVTGNDRMLMEKVGMLRNHGRKTKYEHDEIGYGERIDAIQAAILGAKLPYLEGWTAARRDHAALYDRLLADADVVTPTAAPDVRHVYHLYVIRTERRDTVRDYLNANGVGAGIHYPVPLHRQPAYRKRGYDALRLPVTERIAGEIISLPMYPEMTDAQIERVAETLKEALNP